MPTCGNAAAITALPHPAKVSQKVPIISAASLRVCMNPSSDAATVQYRDVARPRLPVWVSGRRLESAPRPVAVAPSHAVSAGWHSFERGGARVRPVHCNAMNRHLRAMPTNAAEGLPRRRFTVAELEAMTAAGILNE